MLLFYFKYHRVDDFLGLAGDGLLRLKASKLFKNGVKRAIHDHKCVPRHLKIQTNSPQTPGNNPGFD
jgi:hypothetical protein